MPYVVACNQCGSGKKLYFKRYNPLMKDGEEPFVWVEYERDQMLTNKTDLEKGCPSCGCKDLEIIKSLSERKSIVDEVDPGCKPPKGMCYMGHVTDDDGRCGECMQKLLDRYDIIDGRLELKSTKNKS